MITDEFNYNYVVRERQSARLTIMEKATSDEDALTLLQMLGLDTQEVPRPIILPLSSHKSGKYK